MILTLLFVVLMHYNVQGVASTEATTFAYANNGHERVAFDAQTSSAVGIPEHCVSVEFRQMPGRGYNIAKAETLSPHDPGLLVYNVFKAAEDHEAPKWIYKSTVLDDQGCPQWAWKFPNSGHWTFQITDSLSGTRVSEVINSASSYVKESKTSVSEKVDSGSLIGEGFSAAFTASQAFDNTVSSMSSSQTVQTHVGQKATAYTVGVDDVLAEVNDKYWFRLALGYYTESLHGFLETYGTHFVTELVAGAKLSQVSTFSKTSYQTASSSSAAFKEELSFGYLDASGQVDHEHDSEKREKSLTEQQRLSSSMMCRGGDGDCTIDGDQNTIKKFWNNAYKYPATLEVTLHPHDVFVLGERTHDGRYLNNIRWNQFQDYIHDNWQDLGAPNSFDVDRARFLELWKEALSIYCEEFTDADGRPASKCELPDVALPQSADLLLITQASENTDKCAQHREFHVGDAFEWASVVLSQDSNDHVKPLGDTVCASEGYTGCTTVLNVNSMGECVEHHCSEPWDVINNMDGTLDSVIVACTDKVCECAGGEGWGNQCTNSDHDKYWCYLKRPGAYSCPGAVRSDTGDRTDYWSEAPCIDFNSWWYVDKHHDGHQDDGDDIEPRIHAGPNGDGDVCNGVEPIDVKCLTVDDRDASETGERIKCDFNGFECKGKDQFSGRCNNDYKVAYRCSGIPPSGYTPPDWAVNTPGGISASG